ncbi:MAG: hypothetical protein A2042_04015 [Candidatus Schekmanbacteria bacterium GWA2_38_11]|uniref:Uncharacterized protein n=1 Tax=Candidatus Schekmanbacteria bacterium GWA2_38_11 TaxID=1817876 RepID=A0A1F7RMN6_9BACT|nr:MAG: hypothetical protein A2042_04015 [Candidatus Schekmanbacteria bacterium GWA2_38_11]
MNKNTNNNLYFHKFKLLKDFLINEYDLKDHNDVIKKIINILFAGFKNEWKTKNQKFDFSFTFASKKYQGLRFSYNDFGEDRGLYENKILQIFNLFPGVYNKDVLKNILHLMHFPGKKHQTTFGMEWVQGEESPRLKVYFEELFHYYSKFSRIKFSKILSKLTATKIFLSGKENIGAICVDFLPYSNLDLKIYLLLNSIDNVEMPKNIIKFINSSQDIRSAFLNFNDLLNLENHFFNYITYRLNKQSLSSIKFYKIYEINKMNNPDNAYKEIIKYIYLIFNNRINEIKMLFNFCKKNEVSLYPVISSIDLQRGNCKFDLYFSF